MNGEDFAAPLERAIIKSGVAPKLIERSLSKLMCNASERGKLLRGWGK
jgi:hypothetical protein